MNATNRTSDLVEDKLHRRSLSKLMHPSLRNYLSLPCDSTRNCLSSNPSEMIIENPYDYVSSRDKRANIYAYI